MKTTYKSGQWSATGIRIYRSSKVRVPVSRWLINNNNFDRIQDLYKGLKNPLLLNPKIDDTYRYKHQKGFAPDIPEDLSKEAKTIEVQKVDWNEWHKDMGLTLNVSLEEFLEANPNEAYYTPKKENPKRSLLKRLLRRK